MTAQSSFFGEPDAAPPKPAKAEKTTRAKPVAPPKPRPSPATPRSRVDPGDAVAVAAEWAQCTAKYQAKCADIVRMKKANGYDPESSIELHAKATRLALDAQKGLVEARAWAKTAREESGR